MTLEQFYALSLDEQEKALADRPLPKDRQRFEAARSAMQGLLADTEDQADERQKREVTPDGKTFDCHYIGPRKWVYTETCAEATARLAVEHADALLRALK